ncbi:unnamed protein product [Durusdinium trenchii]|uniref:Mei2-like C-terminal RNA recognition motif domain-containing protein n=1 Tax=Durusdinium trenchii TaxID=1381693 RepID=A0ABP0QR73_9DINO
MVRIESDVTRCTTLVMRGLDRQVTREMVARMLHETAPCLGYNYIYVPWTTDGASNIGLAFVNFETFASCQAYVFAATMPENRGKLAVHRIKSIGPAALQGRGANLSAFLRRRGAEALGSLDAPLVFQHGGRTPAATNARVAPLSQHIPAIALGENFSPAPTGDRLSLSWAQPTEKCTQPQMQIGQML